MQEETYVSVPHVGTLDGTTSFVTFGAPNPANVNMCSTMYNPPVSLQPVTIVASISNADVERIADAVLRKLAQWEREATHEQTLSDLCNRKHPRHIQTTEHHQ